jgi:predicted MFS family arabinose efflux permease
MSAAMATIKDTDSKKPSTGKSIFQDMMEGIQFIRHQPVFLALIGLTFFNSIFGMSYITLLPVFAKDILEIGSSGLGYLHAISGIGGIVGTLLTARLSKSIGRGKILSAGAISFGFCLSLFAVSSATLNSIPLSALFIFLAGISSSLYMITIMSTLQIMVPNELRGRDGMTFNLIPIGAQAGFIAEQWGASTAVHRWRNSSDAICHCSTNTQQGNPKSWRCIKPVLSEQNNIVDQADSPKFHCGRNYYQAIYLNKF